MPPVARVGDLHTCPMVTPGTPPVPHVGGPILPPGAMTVTAGGVKVARLTDRATCVGPPDSISMGSPTVQSETLMTARMGDPTVHGGVIAMGLPNVIVGEAASCFPGSVSPATRMTFRILPDGTAVGTFGDNITITGTPEFVSATLGNLTALSALSSGNAIIASLTNSVSIRQCGPGGDNANITSGNWSNPDLYNGTGAPAQVEYHPNQQTMYDGSERWMTTPAHVILGHELTHASHITNGDVTGNPDPAAGGPGIPNDTSGLPEGRGREERRTVGAGADPTYNMPDYSGEPFSENTVRSDQGLETRPRYTRNEW